MVEMVCMDYHQLVKIMLNLKADINIESKKRFQYDHDHGNSKFVEKGSNLFEIAYEIGNKNILFYLMACKREYFAEQEDQFIHRSLLSK